MARMKRRNGHRFNANKVLLDPYAKAIGRDLRWDDALYGYKVGNPGADFTFDERDSAPFAPFGMVIDTAFTWGNDRPPATPCHRASFMRFTSRGSPSVIPECRRNCEAPTPGWARRPPSSICATSA